MSHSKVLSTANNDFTVSLYQALYPSVSLKNLIFSPFSLHTVLGMVGEGARGDTRTELVDGLKFGESDSKVISNGYNLVLTGFQKGASPKTFTLLTANRIYCQAGFALNQKFVKSLKANFKTDFEQLDFSTRDKCRAAAERVNKWVAATTKNKIKDLISDDDLGSETRLVLVNGIYFKGIWKHKFNRRYTSKEPFHVTPTKQVVVDMMSHQNYFPYGKLPKLKAEAVAIPYSGGRLSMVIILPKDVEGLARVQSNIGSVLHGGKSLVWEALNPNYKVELSLPKFKVETTIGNLKDVLENLGMRSMFSDLRADFSGIPDDGEDDDLVVSKVVQKALIEVNEEGAEAAAATAVLEYKTMSCRRPVPIKPIPFVVNRPFYFQIVDHVNGDLVLFSGHVNHPTV